MMKTCASIFLGFLLAFVATGSAAAEDSAAQGSVRIRIANVSQVPYSAVTIRFPSQQEEYGALAPGAYSEYREVAVAYRYASASIVTADGQMVRALAADYLGETRLAPGSYTYTLAVEGRSIRFGFIVDEE